MPSIAAPIALVDPDKVTAAGVLMLVTQYGLRLRMFDAVRRAREWLSTDRLCLPHDETALLNQLYCYPEPRHRAGRPELALLATSVFGIPDPDVAEDQRDQRIQCLLADLLDAVNSACAPCNPTSKPNAAEVQALISAALAVQIQLCASMTEFAILQVQDLQVQLTEAEHLLIGLEPFLCVPCWPGKSPGSKSVWGSVSALVGDDLQADGVDLFLAAAEADAWRTVFAELGNAATGEANDDLCRAAALLRPAGAGRCRGLAEARPCGPSGARPSPRSSAARHCCGPSGPAR